MNNRTGVRRIASVLGLAGVLVGITTSQAGEAALAGTGVSAATSRCKEEGSRTRRVTEAQAQIDRFRALNVQVLLFGPALEGFEGICAA